MPSRRVIIGVIILMMMVCGCAGVPTSGPVEYVPNAESGRNFPQIDVAALPPVKDGDPELILEGFLSALESPARNYEVARQYLTSEASRAWDPDNQTIIYSDSSQSTITSKDGAALLRANQMGHLDKSGHYTSIAQNPFSHDFKMQRVEGQWRISDPGEGIMLSAQRFKRSFKRVTLFYISLDSQSVVPEQIFIPTSSLQPDNVVRKLLAGPDTWLADGVQNLFPTDVTTSGTWVGDDSTAHISLSIEVEKLPARERGLIAAQLLWTLQELDGVTAIQLKAGGHVLSVPGAGADGRVRPENLGVLAPETQTREPELYGVQGGKIVTLTTKSGVSGQLDSSFEVENLAIGKIAISGNQLGVVSEDGRQVWVVARNAKPQKVFEADKIDSLQYVAGHFWWSAQVAGYPVICRLADDLSVQTARVDGLSDSAIVAFKISPDATRVAIIAQESENQIYGMARLQLGDGLYVGNWRPQILNDGSNQITSIRDVAWSSLSSLMVLASSPTAPHFAVFSTDLDAAITTSLGPFGDYDPVRLISYPDSPLNASAVLTSSGRAMRFEEQYRWPAFAEELSDLTYEVE